MPRQTIEIHVRQICPDCNGTGMIQHPAWAKFWRLRDARTLHDDAVFEWFHNEGLLEYERTPTRTLPPHLPPEEIPCECKDGYLERWLTPGEIIAHIFR